jgi:hypothetical protein
MFLSPGLKEEMEEMEEIIRKLMRLAHNLTTDDKNEILNNIEDEKQRDWFKTLITILPYFEVD